MIDQLSLQQWTDIGFMVLVCMVCAKTLFGQSSDGETRRAEWRSELKELEASLRGLIAEACTASSTLDRNLLQRKRELEQVLGKLESHEQAPAPQSAPVQGYNRSKKPNKEATHSDDLPNPTWNTSATSSGQEPLPAVPNGNSESRSEWSLGLAEQLSMRPTEAEAEAEDPVERETFAQMSIMDPITYKVARRLLIAGKEIHVVARKLELPISEIRLLDRLMRREQALKFKEGAEATAGQQHGPHSANKETDFRLTMAPELREDSGIPTIASAIERGGASKSMQPERAPGRRPAGPGIERETTLL